MYIVEGDKFVKGIVVRFEIYVVVQEQFQVGLDFVQVFCFGNFQYLIGQYKCLVWYVGNDIYIVFDGGFGYCLDFWFLVVYQCNFF